uniref:Nonstructural protein 2 n=1 Tax=Tilapia parvovirus TaxID=2660749 RepID=A0A5P8PEB7_9VIRU|nr:nonstructural protein 2 [Tilapia parvovirus]
MNGCVYLIVPVGETEGAELLLDDVQILLEGRWSCLCERGTYEQAGGLTPYLFVSFTRFVVGPGKVRKALGEAKWLVDVQRGNKGAGVKELLLYNQTRAKYSVPVCLSSDSEPEGRAVTRESKSSTKKKRKY